MQVSKTPADGIMIQIISLALGALAFMRSLIKKVSFIIERQSRGGQRIHDPSDAISNITLKRGEVLNNISKLLVWWSRSARLSQLIRSSCGHSTTRYFQSLSDSIAGKGAILDIDDRTSNMNPMTSDGFWLMGANLRETTDKYTTNISNESESNI